MWKSTGTPLSAGLEVQGGTAEVGGVYHCPEIPHAADQLAPHRVPV